MVITLIYRAIAAIILFFVGWNIVTETKVTKQLNAALILIPLILRLLMIK